MIVENENLELRKSLKLLKEGIISLSAMLNKSGFGVVYFGINDDGKVIGLDIGKKTIADITHEIQNELKPLPIKVLIDPVIMDEKNVIKVSVEGNDLPYSAYNKYYIRINDSDIIMNNKQLQSYFEKKDDSYFKWESIETNYTVADVDEDLLIDCIRTANDKGRLNYVYKNATDALTKLGLLTENGNLNNAGLFLFGKNKPLTIKEANYPTDTRVEFGEIKGFKGNIIECIKEAISYIQNHITYKSNIVRIQREEVPEIPLRAIREIVINSFAHCKYQMASDCNQYSIFKSYIKIYNPGSIIKDIDPMKFASGQIGSKIRNVLIASTLFKYGYIYSFGTGFDRTFTLCLENDVEYKYYNDDFGFTFIFNRKKNFLDDKINDKINELDYEILKQLKLNKYMTIPEIASSLAKSEITIHRHMDNLVKTMLL